MEYTTLISAADLHHHLGHDDWAIVDCRFALDNPEQGREHYQQAHIPGAVYAHLNHDLSGDIIPGKTGRHPLPTIAALTSVLSRWGIDDRVQVVAYDAKDGAMAAARLWWLLKWLGHPNVAVLDGGLTAWQDQGYPTITGTEQRAPRTFVARPRPELLVSTDAVAGLSTMADHKVIDVRATARYRGDVEPIDPVAGHIPGAVSCPFSDNVDANGYFLPPAALRSRFAHVLGDVPVEHAIFYCGSGVTAAHNLLAVAHAGLGDARLYAGSWSEWITDPERPVEKAPSPAGS